MREKVFAEACHSDFVAHVAMCASCQWQLLRSSPSQRLRRFMLQRHRRSWHVCGCVVYCQSKFSCFSLVCEWILWHDVVCRDKVPRLTSTSLASEFKRAAMVRQTKFDTTLKKVLASDWVERRHMFYLIRRLSELAPHTVLMLAACQSSFSD